MTLAMSLTNFGIYVALLIGYEFYLTKRRTRPDVYFLASEENWYKILMFILGLSVVGMDIYFKTASFFVYAVLFLSYTFTFKEISEKGITNNLRRVPLMNITSLEVVEKKYGYHVQYKVKQNTYEMVVRKSLSNNLQEAVERIQKMIQKNAKAKGKN